MTHIDPIRPWLAIDASRVGEVAFTMFQPGHRPEHGAIRRYSTENFSTFTDTILQFARETSVDLRGLSAAVAIAGAATGDSIPIARSRWTISRSGLAAMLQSKPLIVNEVAASAWATTFGLGRVNALRGLSVSTLPRPGRYIYVGIHDGIGAAAIDLREHSISVIETEAGHMDYAPTKPVDAHIVGDWFPAHQPSWEQVLMLDQPAGATADPHDMAAMKASALGRMLSNMILATAAWDGVLLTGRVDHLLSPRGARQAFESGFVAHSAFRRLIERTPVWRVDQADAVILGLSALSAFSLA